MKPLAWLVWLALGALLAAGLVAFAETSHLASSVARVLAALVAALAVFGSLYTLYAAVLVRRFFAQPAREPTHCPPVTIVKPLHGEERVLFANLSSFCEQRYAGPIQFVFGVHDRDDPALATVARLRAAYPDADISIVADARLSGPNRKISNIVNMLPDARHDVLIFADSDVSVGPDYVRHIVGALDEPGVGLVTCLYRGRPDPGFWPRVEAQATDYQFLPGVVTGLAHGLARPCFGQTIAMRRATLERIGGLAQFAHHLAEDHAIGEAVRALGERVAVPPFAIGHGCVETRPASMVAHALRWSRTIRSIDPRGHLGSIVTYPFPLALIAVLFAGGAGWSWLVAAAAFASRAVAKRINDRAVHTNASGLWLLPLADLIAFGVFVASFSSSRVVWRGFHFHVDRDGRMCAEADRQSNA